MTHHGESVDDANVYPRMITSVLIIEFSCLQSKRNKVIQSIFLTAMVT